MVEPFGDCAEARLNVPQALTIRKLGEQHSQELVPATEPANPVIPFVALHHPSEGVARQVIEELNQYCAAFEHERSWLKLPPGSLHGPQRSSR